MKDLSAQGYKLLINHITRKAAWIRDGSVEPLDYYEAATEHENGAYRDAVIRGELLGSVERPSMLVHSGSIEQVPISLIDDNPFQGRTAYREEGIRQLADSIRALGLLQVPVGRRKGGHVELAFGMTRRRAFERLSEEDPGYLAMPVNITMLSDQQMALLSWDENESRTSFTCIEQAQFIRSVMDRFRWTQFEAAKYLGMARSTLANKLRLLTLPDEVKGRILRGDITERQALALLSGAGAGVQFAHEAARGISSDVIRAKATPDKGGSRRKRYALNALIFELCTPDAQPHRFVGDDVGLRRAFREVLA